ncbi:MAG: metal ABC transporter substrate-binding protein [Acidimicrobiales bacterium]
MACTTAVASCGGSAPRSTDSTVAQEAERPVVVASNSVVQSIVRLVGGDAFDVRTMIPDGKDPHDHEPSASDIAELSDARLIVQVGLDYEHGIEDLIARKQKEGVPVLTLTDHVTVRDGDPHVFTDPLTVFEAVDELAAALGSIAPVDGAAALAGARTALERAHEKAASELSGVAGSCVLVTDHDALEYFARRFGCEVAGVVTPSFSSGAETSAAQVQRIVDDVEKARGTPGAVRAVFVEQGSSRSVAEKIREITGVKVVELGVHSLPADGSYSGYVVALATGIAEGLAL